MVRPALTVVTDFSTTFERSPPPITTGSALYSSDYETSDKDSALPRQQVVFTSAPRPFVQRAVPIQPSIDTKGTQRVFVPRRTHSAPAVLPIICPRPQRIDPAARAAFLEEPTGPPVRPMHEYAQPPKLLSYVPGARRVCRKARCHCREVMNSEYPAAVLLSASLALRVAYGEAAEVVHERLRRAVLDKDSSQAVHLLAQAWLLSGPIGRFELMREVNAQITAAVLAFHREMDEPVRSLSSFAHLR
jgi:hypothetical protein